MPSPENPTSVTPVALNTTLTSKLDPKAKRQQSNAQGMLALLAALRQQEATIREGGGAKAIDAQHAKQRLTARERLALLLDPNTDLFELSAYAGFDMYAEWGGAPGAGVVCGLGRVSNRLCMIVANDATVKAGAFFPMTAKKVLRAQHIAMENHLPTLYLVDSSGIFLPLQEDVFPDQDDFGRIFRNNARMSAMGIPQITAIMGMCVAGGAYLPVMTDHVLMTEGSGLFLAGPALVEAAIGQKYSAEELGGATMHAEISGTVDFKEPNDHLCLARLRSLVSKLGQAARRRPRGIVRRALQRVAISADDRQASRQMPDCPSHPLGVSALASGQDLGGDRVTGVQAGAEGCGRHRDRRAHAGCGADVGQRCGRHSRTGAGEGELACQAGLPLLAGGVLDGGGAEQKGAAHRDGEHQRRAGRREAAGGGAQIGGGEEATDGR